MKLAVVGSRGFQDSERLGSCLDRYQGQIECIVSGGARGADTLAADYARAHGIALKEYLPEYDRYGRAAPILRNRLIVDDCDTLIAFWDGKSHGTRDSIDHARRSGKQVIIELFTP